MATKGNPVITFGSTTFDSSSCIQSASITRGADDLTYHCGDYTKHIAGDESIELSFSIALDATDTTTLSALDVGQTGTCEFYPAGNTTGNIEFSTTNGTVTKADIGDTVNSVVMLDVTIAWDDITVGTAS